MYQAMSVCIPCLIVFIPLVLFASWFSKPLFIPRQRTHKSVAHVRNLLNPSHTPLESLLLARAIPNQRLVHAFGLTNTFVSGDVKIHRTFTANARTLIAAENAGEKEASWRAVASSTEATVLRFLPVDHDIVAFSTFIQCVTFAVVLSTLFDADLDAIRYEDVVYVTEAINRRWENSKTEHAAAMFKEDDNMDSYSLRRINELVEQWVVDLERFQNPLNFILPAYETMWRVVAATVARVYHYPDDTLHKTAITFATKPTEDCFEAFGGEDGECCSMQAIIFEVLRLHPPTRHIARRPSAELPSAAARSWRSRWWNALVAPEVEIADIQALHVSKDEYGEDADVFNPMRFHPSRCEGKTQLELYAFGYGRLRCVAVAWAPMAAGVITAKVVEQLDEAGRIVTVGPKIGGRSGWEGWEVV